MRSLPDQTCSELHVLRGDVESWEDDPTVNWDLLLVTVIVVKSKVGVKVEPLLWNLIADHVINHVIHISNSSLSNNINIKQNQYLIKSNISTTQTC